MEQSVVWLCLVILPLQSCIPEDLLSRRLFRHPRDLDVQNLGSVRAAPRRAACRRSSWCNARLSWRSMAVSYVESFESILSFHMEAHLFEV
jgi:hypothetical protein